MAGLLPLVRSWPSFAGAAIRMCGWGSGRHGRVGAGRFDPRLDVLDGVQHAPTDLERLRSLADVAPVANGLGARAVGLCDLCAGQESCGHLNLLQSGNSPLT